MTAEQGTSHYPDILNSPDRPLAGKTAIVTGGSRDVGAGIVKALTEQGVRVVFSYNNKPKRAEDVLSSVADFGGEAHGIATDISTAEGRGSFFTSALGILGGSVDFLILSTSGPTPELNEIASNDLLDQALPHMQKGGTVIRMQSVPGHFMPQLRGSFSLKEYNAVAESKYPDLKSLRRRIPEMEEHGVRFLEVCPPIVSGTNNVRFARRIDPTAEDQHYVVSDRLGLPHEVTPEQVGSKIVDLLSNPDIESGYTEFFDGVDDAQTVLETLYGVSQVYVNTLERLDDLDGQRHGIGRTIASLEQTTRPDEPDMIDESWFDGTKRVSSVRITPDHANGHFTKESGLPNILPAHKQIRMAVEAVKIIERSFGRNLEGVKLRGFESAEFFISVSADKTTEIVIIPTQKNDGSYEVEIEREGDRKKIALIKGLRIAPAGQSDYQTLLEDQLIEGANQTTLLVGTGNVGKNNLPLLRRIGRTEFVAGGIRGGEGIVYDALTKKDGKRSVNGSVVVYSEGHIVGVVSEIKAVLVSEKTTKRLLSPNL